MPEMRTWVSRDGHVSHVVYVAALKANSGGVHGYSSPMLYPPQTFFFHCREQFTARK
jgi:hypothetical protein